MKAFLHRGWPFVALATVHGVKPGEEFITDYGDRYWNPSIQLEEQANIIQNMANRASS